MQPITPAFVPPVVPLVPAAANAIVPTGAALGGALTGAKAGAVLGPKGALAGALLGGVLGPLLVPLPTAPGTLPTPAPIPLDPAPAPEPEPNPDTGPIPLPYPNGDPFTVREWSIRWQAVEKRADTRWCNDDDLSAAGGTFKDDSTGIQITGKSVQVQTRTTKRVIKCRKQDENSFNEYEYFNRVIVTWNTADGEPRIYESERSVEQNRNSLSSYLDGPTVWSVEVVGIDADGEPQPVPEPLRPTTPKKPKTLPVPIEPLPQPEPEPEPAKPLPEPQPEPLNPPSPDNPTAPPIPIPKAPPAVPQAPPQPATFPIPGPGQPGTVPIPLPIPGVPSVPEPTPDPNISPAPGPTPEPGTNPEPGEAPIPVPPRTPIPTVPGTPTTPDTSNPTLPDGSLAPKPSQLPATTSPNVHFPVTGEPPVTDGGTRPDLTAIAAEVGRIEQKVASLQRKQKDIPWWLIGPILEALSAMLEQDIPGTTYQLQGVCEAVEDGEPQPIAEFPVEPAKNLGAIINRLDTIDQMLQQHLAWKTPTCSSRPIIAGDWRTISFISDEVSPEGKSRLRKRFRYRSSSGVGLDGLVDHWKNFSFSAGAVIVWHQGAAWGTPKVWASSIDEGKRVIRHAAGEAGIDPDQVGEWRVSGSDNPRYGMPGTMRVNTSGGYYWITERLGSDNRPPVRTV